jgi:[ribosomal protein S18]-alanine N-acetyltransferase
VRKLQPTARWSFMIRRMFPDDLAGVLRLQQDCFAHPWSAELLGRELTHEWSTILLAEAQGEGGSGRELWGFLIFWLVHDELHILNLATGPAFRRRGVARALMDEALSTGRSHRCTLATLEVRRGNEAAITMYRSYGFRPVGVRPNYYVDEGEDAIVMNLDL